MILYFNTYWSYVRSHIYSTQVAWTYAIMKRMLISENRPVISKEEWMVELEEIKKYCELS
jgi:hypothetical protein